MKQHTHIKTQQQEKIIQKMNEIKKNERIVLKNKRERREKTS